MALRDSRRGGSGPLMNTITYHPVTPKSAFDIPYICLRCGLINKTVVVRITQTITFHVSVSCIQYATGWLSMSHLVKIPEYLSVFYCN